MQTRWDSCKIVTSHQVFLLKPFFSLVVALVIGEGPYYLAVTVNVNVCPNGFSFEVAMKLQLKTVNV